MVVDAPVRQPFRGQLFDRRRCIATRVVVACAAVTICAAATPGSAAQQPTFRATGDSVRVFVTVTERDGRLVTTLVQNDFEVRDEGRIQPLTLFDNTSQPIRLIV